MRRGFAYSLAALALALAVAQAAIIFTSAQSGAAYGRSLQKDAAVSASFAEGSFSLQSGLLLSCGLAAAAATQYEESTNLSFANKSCVLSFLARNGNVTGADCPGEAFALIETANRSYSLLAWQQAASKRNSGTIGIADALQSVYATDNGTHTTCNAVARVAVATTDNSTFISKSYAAQRTVANAG